MANFQGATDQIAKEVSIRVIQQGTANLYQEMFENAVAALLVAMAQLPSRTKKVRAKSPHRDAWNSPKREGDVGRARR